MAVVRINTPLFEEMFQEASKLEQFSVLLQCLICGIMKENNIESVEMTTEKINGAMNTHDIVFDLRDKEGIYNIALKEFTTKEPTGKVEVISKKGKK